VSDSGVLVPCSRLLPGGSGIFPVRSRSGLQPGRGSRDRLQGKGKTTRYLYTLPFYNILLAALYEKALIF
jgi:hypothetical protein